MCVGSRALTLRAAGRHAPLITHSMWRFIVGHSIMQTCILLALLLLFKSTTDAGTADKNGIVFFSGATVPPAPCVAGNTGCIVSKAKKTRWFIGFYSA